MIIIPLQVQVGLWQKRLIWFAFFSQHYYKSVYLFYNTCLVDTFRKFRSRRWGSSLFVCARLTVRSSPHRHKQKFSGARVCRVTFKHLPRPLRSHILSFGSPPFPAPKSHSAGGRGGPRIFFLVGILIFLLLMSPCKIAKTLRQPLLGELAMSRKRREREEKKMPFIVATYIYASSQGQRKHSAWTNCWYFSQRN
jgi:hypothetical protein